MHRLVWGKGWKRFIVAVVVTLIVVTALMFLTMEVTSRPGFCKTCHFMRPYYYSWAESSHNFVTCTDCHFPPGIENKIKGKMTALSMLVNYFTGVYKKGKPWAEISDQSCMRSGCHETRTLAGKVNFKKNILFDHAPHLSNLRRDKKLRCTSCHSQIVQGDHIKVTETSCFLCHFKDTSEDSPLHACGKCHEPPVKDPAGIREVVYDHAMVVNRNIPCKDCHGDMITGDGSVPKIRCNHCHAELEKIKKYDDTEFMHRNHITEHKIECLLCHTEIRHKSISRSELVKPDCQACHPNFHRAQLNIFSGQGGKGVPLHPSPMFESGLNCQACHVYHRFYEGFQENGGTFIANAESCESCHGKGYSKILQSWKADADRRLKQMKRVLDWADRMLAARKGRSGYEAASRKMSDALYNYKLVKSGNAIHNISFSGKLLESSYKLARESLDEVGVKDKLPPYERASGLIPGECSNCHAGVEHLETRAFGWIFPHGKHLSGKNLSCASCHSNVEKHGQLVAKKQDCMNCHHRDIQDEPKCEVCHQEQYAVYFSKLSFSTLSVPNVMAEGVTCVDCHQDESKKLVRPGKEGCTHCHEKDYEEMFDQWQASAKEWLALLREKVQSQRLRGGDRAFEILRLLEKDGSRGIHNPELYETLAEEAMQGEKWGK